METDLVPTTLMAYIILTFISLYIYIYIYIYMVVNGPTSCFDEKNDFIALQAILRKLRFIYHFCDEKVSSPADTFRKFKVVHTM